MIIAQPGPCASSPPPVRSRSYASTPPPAEPVEGGGEEGAAEGEAAAEGEGRTRLLLLPHASSASRSSRPSSLRIHTSSRY